MTESSNEGLCYRQDRNNPHEWGSVVGCDCIEYENPLGQKLAKSWDFAANRLDPSDPFDKVLIEMRNMNRKKRADYAADADIFSNFRDTASMLGLPGFTERESALFLILVKVARLKSLRANGRMDNPANESVVDTVLDLAVYSVIYLALTREYENPRGRPLKEHEKYLFSKEKADRSKYIDDLLRQGAITDAQARDLLRTI